MGRDALCKLSMTIWCLANNSGHTESNGPNDQMIVKPEKAKVYWLGEIMTPLSRAYQECKKYLKMQLPREAREPPLFYHCTTFYDVTRSEQFEQKWT